MEEKELYLTEDATDEEIIQITDRWLKESVPFHDELLRVQTKSVNYYRGVQTDREKIPVYNADSVYNRIFEATETLVPIVTGTAHQFIAIPGKESEVSIRRASELGKVLLRKYEDLEVQKHLESVSRDLIIKRFGVMKWFWNTETDDVDVKTIDPRFILIPKLRIDPHDLPYKMEIQEYTKGELLTEFPELTKEKRDELVKGKRLVTVENEGYESKDCYQVLEIWTKEYVVWRNGTNILRREPNPYFDFAGETREEDGEEMLRFFNHFDAPQDCYVFFPCFTVGDSPVGDTSLAEIGIPIQDDINTQKRQIINNLIKMGNGQVYVDSEALTKEQIDQLSNEPGLIIVGKNIVSENRIKRESGTPIPNAHFSNLNDSIVAFDNVFGVHGAVRGEAQGKTLGGQILNRQQDLSRIDLITRVLNRGVARLADGLVQLMKMFYTERHVIKVLGRDGAVEFVKMSRDEIEDGVVINVKSGQTPSIDPLQRYNQAVQLWQLNAIDPETLYQRLDFPNPADAAKKLQAWKTGQLLLAAQIRAQETIATAQATAPVEEEAEIGADTKVETPLNSIQRAEGAQGGGGAVLPEPPKVNP